MLILAFVLWYAVAAHQSFDICHRHDQRDECRAVHVPSNLSQL